MATDRPTKKQQELLQFIDGYVKGNGYGPTYREVMRALGYKSVSTVATHVDNLIAKGFLVKSTYSARSLEVVKSDSQPASAPTAEQTIERLIAKYEKRDTEEAAKDVEVLRASLEIIQRSAP
jgi:repressor LexA